MGTSRDWKSLFYSSAWHKIWVTKQSSLQVNRQIGRKNMRRHEPKDIKMTIPNERLSWGDKTVTGDIRQQETELQSKQLLRLPKRATHEEENISYSICAVWWDPGKRLFGIIRHIRLDLQNKSESKTSSRISQYWFFFLLLIALLDQQPYCSFNFHPYVMMWKVTLSLRLVADCGMCVSCRRCTTPVLSSFTSGSSVPPSMTTTTSAWWTWTAGCASSSAATLLPSAWNSTGSSLRWTHPLYPVAEPVRYNVL